MVLGKVTASQLQSHLELNHLYEPLQSGFRPLHCTKTTLLRVATDLLLSAESGFLIFLSLLNLSSAFDTVFHKTLSLSVILPLAFKALHFPGSPRTLRINSSSSLFKDMNPTHSLYLWCSSRICSLSSAF